MEEKKPSFLEILFLGIVVFLVGVTVFDSDWGINKKDTLTKYHFYSSYDDEPEFLGGPTKEQVAVAADELFARLDEIESRGERPLDVMCEQPNTNLGYHVLYVRSKIMLDESGTGLVFPEGSSSVGFDKEAMAVYHRLVEGKAYRCHLTCDEYEAIEATTCDQNPVALPPTKEEVEKKNSEIAKKNDEEHAKWLAGFLAEQKALVERPQRLLKVTCTGLDMDLGYQTLYVWMKESFDGMGGLVWPNETQRVSVDDQATLGRLVEGKAYECHLLCKANEKTHVYTIEVRSCKQGTVAIPLDEEITEDSPYTQWTNDRREEPNHKGGDED